MLSLDIFHERFTVHVQLLECILDYDNNDDDDCCYYYYH